jgi:hypothetical protein
MRFAARTTNWSIKDIHLSVETPTLLIGYLGGVLRSPRFDELLDRVRL